jgi:hypothetical protein
VSRDGLIDDDGAVNNEAIVDRLDALLNDRLHLAASDNARPLGRDDAHRHQFGVIQVGFFQAEPATAADWRPQQ